MRRYLVLVAVAAALAVGAVAVLAATGDDNPSDRARRNVSTVPTEVSALERARELIRTCRVRSTLSLHSGAFYLALKDGSELELPAATEPQVFAEIQRATPRCGSVPAAME